MDRAVRMEDPGMMGSLVKMDDQVIQARMGAKVIEVLLVTQDYVEMMVYLVRQADQVKMDSTGAQAILAKMETKVPQVKMEILVCLVMMEHLVVQGLTDNRDNEELQDSKEILEHQDQMVYQGNLEIWDDQAIQAMTETKASVDHQGLLDYQAILVNKADREYKESLVLMDNLDKME